MTPIDIVRGRGRKTPAIAHELMKREQPRPEWLGRRLAQMRHDIRNFLDAILGLSDILVASNTLDPQQKEMAVTLKSSIEDLRKLIEDMLDFSQLAEEAVLSQADEAGEPPEKRQRVLLVEDYAPTILMMTKFLEELGYEYEVAQTGREALEEYTNGSYDCVLMDLQLPDIDGFETTRRIRAIEKEIGRPIYHGWTYGNDGQLVGVPGTTPMPSRSTRSRIGLRRPARFEEYRGFWFMCLDQDAPPLADYLAGAKDYIDLVIDQSPSGPDGDHRRRAGIRRRRQLEADGREQRRRLSPAGDPFDLAQLHGQFRREDRAAQGSRPGAADPRQGGRARQRPLHHRQHQFPRPAGRQVDSALWRGGEGGDRRDPRRAGRTARRPSGRSASPTPTAIWSSSPIW